MIGGYILAYLLAWAAVSIHQLFTQNAAAQASAGVSAFGDLILFIGVLGFLMLFPTGLMVYFLFKKFQRR
ncbi:MAG: hypothetical protein ABI986_09715 [Chloroflexota bacterium]